MPEWKKARAREFRKHPTVAERILWLSLRSHRLEGWKFRRQALIYGYIVDFYCHAASLVVEVDGPHHQTPEQAAVDRLRDRALQRYGFTVLHLDGDHVSRDPAWARRMILEATGDQRAPRSDLAHA